MLMFNWKQIKKLDLGLSYDDVLLVPKKSEIRSRRDPSLKSKLTKEFEIEMPFVSANMDTVTESSMILAMNELGATGILHRFMSIEKQVAELKTLQEKQVQIRAASVGVTPEDRDRAQALVQAGCNLMTIDIAHGHSVQMLDTLKWLKDNFPSLSIIAGNVATPEATLELIEAGASAVKVGIGPGSMCTTRVITGCGLPQLTAVALCAEVGFEHQVPVIADGGIKNSGDIVKAFAAGASTVMLGSMLAGAIETPGEIKNGRKLYRGMASKSAQVSWRGGVPEGMAPEGESSMVWVKGHVRDVVLELSGGVRSGMSYLNATELHHIAENAQFIRMTPGGFKESLAHGVTHT